MGVFAQLLEKSHRTHLCGMCWRGAGVCAQESPGEKDALGRVPRPSYALASPALSFVGGPVNFETTSLWFHFDWGEWDPQLEGTVAGGRWRSHPGMRGDPGSILDYGQNGFGINMIFLYQYDLISN